MRLRKPLSPREVEICRRVRSVREAARLSRPVFGRFLGLDSSKLSNIENLRVPVDYITGNALCRIFRVSPSWLVTGQGRPTHVLPASVYAPIAGTTGRTPFSEAYPQIQKAVSEAQQKITAQTEAIFQKLQDREAEQGVGDLSPSGLERSWQEAVLSLGASERAEIDADLMTAVFGSPFNVEFENELAIVSGFDDKSGMRTVAVPADLINKVLNLTQARGAKAKLARQLMVSRQRLNEWLSGRSKPSARYLLLLLHWATTQSRRLTRSGQSFEREQKKASTDDLKKQAVKKRAGSADTRPAQKTRKSKSTTNEKAKSDRKQK